MSPSPRNAIWRAASGRYIQSVLIFLLLPLPSGGDAEPLKSDQFMTGNRLYEFCRTDNASCTSYIAGVSDLLSSPGWFTKEVGYCPPEGMSLRQGILAFQKVAAERPDMLSSGAAGIVAFALRRTFPCRDSSQ